MNAKKWSLFILMMLIAQTGFKALADAEETTSEEASRAEVTFETTAGSFTLELYPDKAPKTVTNFLTYVDQGFYENTLFHRVIPRFVVQGGGFEKGMQRKQTLPPVENESDNGLRNIAGTVAMARTSDPDSATSQFFINLKHNVSLDAQKNFPGYTVFGKVTEGMDVIRKIADVPTKTVSRLENVPEEDIVVLSVTREGGDALVRKPKAFIQGEDYVVLDEPVPTRDGGKVEVVEAFAYGCPHCFGVEPHIAAWRQRQGTRVDFWHLPAVWNESMRLYAQVFYTAREMGIVEKMHLPLFNAIIAQQRQLRSPSELANFFAEHGVDKSDFIQVFNSTAVELEVEGAEERVRRYEISGVPQFIVNGKYRIDPVRAGGRKEMLDVVDFLVRKELDSLKQQAEGGENDLRAGAD